MTRKQNRIPTDAVVAREGDIFMLIIAHYWAKAETVEKAIAGIRRESGKTRSQIEQEGWTLLSVEPRTYMDEMGYIMWYEGQKYEKIAEYHKPRD